MSQSHPYSLFLKRACIECPPASCNCKAGESCIWASRTCDQCDVITCVPLNGSSSGGGISGGAVAGAVVSCVFVALLLAGGLWYLRRRRAMRKAEIMASKRRTPFSMEHAVGTPSGEKPPTTPGTPAVPPSPHSPHASAGTSHTLHYTESDINLDPFADAHSVHSGTSSHVIPIAYVPPNSASMSLADGHRQSSNPSIATGSPYPPSRPFRSPELNLKLEPPKSAASRLSVGQSDLRPPRFSSPYAASQRSGASRASTVSSVGSFIYGDTPVVVSQAQGGIRQVLGVARPEVVQVPAGGLSVPSTPGTGADLVRSWSQRSKKNAAPPVPELPPASVPERSPFSPDSEGGDPFADLGEPENDDTSRVRSVHSVGTFGHRPIPGTNISAKSPTQPQSATFLAEPIGLGYDSRPSSIGTVVHSAERVVLGGTASASTEDLGSFMPPPPLRRASGASVADSILSGFPFVPPSPIAAGDVAHMRPDSLAMSISESVADHPQSYGNAGAMPTLSELARQEEQALEQGQAARLPSRHTLGMSTFSSVSASSSGLDAFPFHFAAGGAPRDSIDTSADLDLGLGKPSGLSVPAGRASLDTLALSRDVEAFPLPDAGYKR